MSPTVRITRSKSSLTLSPPQAEQPHPTLADVNLRPRRRLRDSSSSRGSSLGGSSTSGRGDRAFLRGRSASNRPNRADIRLERLTSRCPITPHHVAASQDVDETADDDTYQPSLSESLSPPPPDQISPEPNPRPWCRAQRRDLFEFLDEVNDGLPSTQTAANHVLARSDSQPFHSEYLNSASGSALTSPSDPESAARRYTAQEKGKGRAVLVSSMNAEDDDGDRDESIQVTGMRLIDKRKRRSSEDIVLHDGGSLAGDEERSLGGFSEFLRGPRCEARLMLRSLSGVFLCTRAGRYDTLVGLRYSPPIFRLTHAPAVIFCAQSVCSTPSPQRSGAIPTHIQNGQQSAFEVEVADAEVGVSTSNHQVAPV